MKVTSAAGFRPALHAHLLSKLPNHAIRRGAFASLPELIAAIDAYFAANNTPTPHRLPEPRPPDEIIEKVPRVIDTRRNHQPNADRPPGGSIQTRRDPAAQDGC